MLNNHDAYCDLPLLCRRIVSERTDYSLCHLSHTKFWLLLLHFSCIFELSYPSGVFSYSNIAFRASTSSDTSHTLWRISDLGCLRFLSRIPLGRQIQHSKGDADLNNTCNTFTKYLLGILPVKDTATENNNKVKSFIMLRRSLSPESHNFYWC